MSPSVMGLGAGGVGESRDALRIKSSVPTNVSQVETSSVALRLAAAFCQPYHAGSTLYYMPKITVLCRKPLGLEPCRSGITKRCVAVEATEGQEKRQGLQGLGFIGDGSVVPPRRDLTSHQNVETVEETTDRFQHESFPVVNLSTEPYRDAFDWVDIVLYILHGIMVGSTAGHKGSSPDALPRNEAKKTDVSHGTSSARSGIEKGRRGYSAHTGGESGVLDSDEGRIEHAYRKNLKREHGCICAECGVQSTARTSRVVTGGSNLDIEEK
ncbi:hypothetical protein B0H13DRAFT_1882263 [Mycena leptocephala]|nr:hypothetical protein B0H13DRAFT_1882263 [Mycena leptocephala]